MNTHNTPDMAEKQRFLRSHDIFLVNRNKSYLNQSIDIYKASSVILVRIRQGKLFYVPTRDLGLRDFLGLTIFVS